MICISELIFQKVATEIKFLLTFLRMFFFFFFFLAFPIDFHINKYIDYKGH